MYFKYDLKIGFRKSIPYFLVIAAIVLLSCATLQWQTAAEELAGLELPRALNSMDYFLHTFEGMRPWSRMSGEEFRLPITWFLINMLLFYFTGKYPYSEMDNNHGANVLMRGGSRSRWFVSKWFWSMLSVVVYYATAYIFVILFCLVGQISVCFFIEPMEYQNLLSPVSECTSADTVKVLMIPVISSVAAVTVQLTLSLILSSFFSFLFMAVLYISSAYYFTPYLLGNYSMLARNSIFNTGGIGWGQMIVVLVLIILLSMLAGVYIFRRQDILGGNIR